MQPRQMTLVAAKVLRYLATEEEFVEAGQRLGPSWYWSVWCWCGWSQGDPPELRGLPVVLLPNIRPSRRWDCHPSAGCYV